MIPRRSANSTASEPGSLGSPVAVIRPSTRSLLIPDGFPDPVTFGLPSTFTAWRPAQLDAINRIMDSTKRFIVICAPTGMGKSLLAAGSGVLTGRRTVMLASTLGLADQNLRAFSSIARDIRGMANYRCNAASSLAISPNTVVADAPCLSGYRCPMRSNGCDYFDAYRRARQSPLITTTYQCWMYDAMKDPGEALHVPDPINPDNPNTPTVDMLICDEAADAVEEIQRFVSVSLTCRECLHLHLDWPGDRKSASISIDDWRAWAVENAPDIRARVTRAEQSAKSGNGNGNGGAKELKALREMLRKLDRLSTIPRVHTGSHEQAIRDQWIMSPHLDPDTRSLDSIDFIPLDPSRYAESSLWRHVPRIILLSATIRPKTADMLGISPADMQFIEYPSTFPAARRPIIVVPSVMLSHRTEQNDDVMLIWLRVIDSIISGRLDRKGIVHATSYIRARLLFDNSAHRSIMLIHNAGNRAQVIADFLSSPAPRVLVSPSITGGYDFHGDLARYAIISKLPFQSVTDPVVKARQSIDPEYGLYLTSQEIIQSAGRVMRSEDDYGETFIVDDSFRNWFFQKTRKFYPEYWIDAIRWVEAVPPPLDLTK